MFNPFNFFSWFSVIDDEPDPWKQVTSIVDAEKIVTRFRGGEKIDLQTLKLACDACDVTLHDVIRDHNRAHWLRHNMVA